jgi:hypothetical protein
MMIMNDREDLALYGTDFPANSFLGTQEEHDATQP